MTVLPTTVGRYELLEQLGSGGMAEVFKAKSQGVEGFEKTLVVKRIFAELGRSRSFADRFIREAKLAVRLSHANVVQVFDMGQSHDPDGAERYFLATEYVSGLDLGRVAERASQRGLALPPAMITWVGAEVAKGLEHAHRRRDAGGVSLGIVHADLSPRNILISWEGEVKVTDFGIAAALRGAGFTAPARAHLHMSPEQARGEELDARSDVYSLGVVLHQLCPPDVPLSLATAIERAMRPQRAERYASAAEFHDALLGVFYETGERFGAVQLAEWISALRDENAGSVTRPVDLDGVQLLPLGKEARVSGLVGRSAELRLLGKYLANAEQGNPEVCLLVAGAGMGKSALLEEMHRRIQRGGFDIGYFLASCPEDGLLRPYSAVSTMLRSLLGVEGAEDIAAEDVALRLRALGMQPDEIQVVLRQSGVMTEERAVAGFGEGGILEAALAKIFVRLSEDRVHAFAWDDAQWMDPASRTLMMRVLKKHPRKIRALVLLATQGDESEWGWVSQRMELGPLAPSAVTDLAERRNGAIGNDSQSQGALARLEGNPLHIDVFLALSAATGGVPPYEKPEELLDRALGLLTQPQRAILDAASVLGAPMTREVLDRMTTVSGVDADQALLALVEGGWLLSVGHGTVRFASSTLAALARRQLSPRAAVALHRAAAKAIVASSAGASVAQRSDRAARQHALGEQPEDAARLWSEAFALYEASGQYESAIAAGLHALEFPEAFTLKDELVDLLGQVSSLVARLRHPGRAIDAALKVVAAVGDAPGQTHAVRARAYAVRVAAALGHGDAARLLLEQARIIGGPQSTPLLEETALEAALGLGWPIESLDDLERRATGIEPRAALLIARALASAGRVAAAEDVLQRVDRSIRDDASLQILAAQVRLLAAFVDGDNARAVVEASLAVELAERSALRFEHAVSLHNLGDALSREGEAARAYAAFWDSLQLSAIAGYEQLADASRAHLAYLEGCRGSAVSLAQLEDQKRRCLDAGNASDAADITLLLGKLHAARGNPRAAVAELTVAKEAGLALGRAVLMREASRALARV